MSGMFVNFSYTKSCLFTHDWPSFWCHTFKPRQHNIPWLHSLVLNLSQVPYNFHAISVHYTHSIIPKISKLREVLLPNWDKKFAKRTKCSSDPKEPFLLFLNHLCAVNHSTSNLCTISNHTIRKLHPKWWGEKGELNFSIIFIFTFYFDPFIRNI